MTTPDNGPTNLDAPDFGPNTESIRGDVVEDAADDDVLDGCDDLIAADLVPVPDADIDGIVLFADVDPDDVDAIEQRIADYDELFRAP